MPKTAHTVSNLVFPGSPNTGNNYHPLCPQTFLVKHTLNFTSQASAFTRGKTDANYNSPIDTSDLAAAAAHLPRVTHCHIFPPPAQEAAAGHHPPFTREQNGGREVTALHEAGQMTTVHTPNLWQTEQNHGGGVASFSVEEAELRGTRWSALVLGEPAAVVKPWGTLHHSTPDPLKGEATYVNQILTTYDSVASKGAPDFQGVQVPVPTNLNVHQWRAINYMYL